MRVGFYHATLEKKSGVGMAPDMVASVRQAMPGVPILQFTNSEAANVPGVDGICVRPSMPIALAVLDAYAQCHGRWLLLDTDVIVQQDVRHVFEQHFDIAVADRGGTLKPHEVGSKFMTLMPYNKGAVFSTSAVFWREALDRCRGMKAHLQEWMGDQQAMNDVIATGRFNVKVLESRYNYAPRTRYEHVRDKAIVHYKGPRKAWRVAA